MGELEERGSYKLVKALNLGDSGSGKTGALGQLAMAGYELGILDFDNGAQILLDPTVLHPDYRKNINIEVCTDRYDMTPQGPVCNLPQAAMKGMNCLNDWPGWGPIYEWGPNRILVMDSLTFFGDACMRQVLAQVGRAGGRRYQGDWGKAMDIQEGVLQSLYAEQVKCHVIINCHIKMSKDPTAPEDIRIVGKEGKETKLDLTPKRAFPYALGSALPPKVGRYFNTAVRTKSMGSGMSLSRVITPIADNDLELKVPLPSILNQDYPLESAWLTIFNAITGEERKIDG